MFVFQYANEIIHLTPKEREVPGFSKTVMGAIEKYVYSDTKALVKILANDIGGAKFLQEKGEKIVLLDLNTRKDHKINKLLIFDSKSGEGYILDVPTAKLNKIKINKVSYYDDTKSGPMQAYGTLVDAKNKPIRIINDAYYCKINSSKPEGKSSEIEVNPAGQAFEKFSVYFQYIPTLK